ncbi:IS3 family transposase [Calditrichota bacterium GD2]
MVMHTNLKKRELIKWLRIPRSRYYDWKKRQGIPNHHNGQIPKSHWILPEEELLIVNYCSGRLIDGYRRETYKMIDENVVAVSPSTVYRVLKKHGLLNRWNPPKEPSRKGFIQPLRVHDHWHIDISYLNVLGTFLFLITVLDGASRYVVHHEVRSSMTGYDVELTIEKALEKFPEARPRIISDNGSQFTSKEFKEYMRQKGLNHVRTSVAHPQSNGKLERFHGTIKQESIRKRSYVSIEDAREQIDDYITYYNTKRLHSAIYYLTPEDVLLGRTEERLKERQQKLDAARAHRLKLNQERNVA